MFNELTRVFKHSWLAKKNADIFLAITVMTIIALFILPIPTPLIDILICANIALAIIILLLAIYIPSSLNLSSFPTIILLGTLFRLGLNVATSRLILLNADAGQMILAFGNTVVAGNLVVGIVIFLLLMLINMLVVAKGSERVAEVSARFTLDAMPGKQMSIDADVRAGTIDQEQAKIKREELSKESQLFGAMDGAMKFVKGDVIAGIIIFFINIIAGMIIGKFEHGMELDEALSTFAILSVGDGLVSIIPGLLMSVCAGLIVTRVDGMDTNADLGENLASQVLSYPKAFYIASAFTLLMAFIPGLPTVPLMIISIIVLAVAITVNKTNSNIQTKEPSNFSDQTDENISNEHSKNTHVLPICIEIYDDLIPFVDDNSNFTSELIPMLRESLEIELGIDFPGIRVRPALIQNDPSINYSFLLNEVPVASGKVDPTLCLVSTPAYDIKAMGIKDVTPTKNPCTQTTASLVSIKYQATLEQAGLMVWRAPSIILLHLSAILRKSAKDFITIHETQVMLDRIESLYPALVREVVPKAVSLFQLTDILKRLLSEEVSIKDIKTILQTLAEYGPSESNSAILTEYVRVRLARYLCYRFGHGKDSILVYLLSPEIEDMLRSSIVTQENRSYLALEPDMAQEILTAIKKEFGQLSNTTSKPVILTSYDIRRHLRKLMEIELYEAIVMSYQELSPEFKVQPIGRISLQFETQDEYESPPFEYATAMPN